MNTIEKIERRRAQIIEQVSSIRSMELGTLNEQMLPVRHKDKAQPVLHGPYYVLSRRENGKTRSRRVGKDELEQVQRDVSNRKKFEALCAEFKELTRELGELERAQTAAEQAEKKRLKPQSNKARKSNG